MRADIVVFFKLYFIVYAFTVVPISLSSPPLSTPHTLKQSYYCSCPLVIHISSLATPFPILYLHPYAHSVTTNSYFLIPSPLNLFPHNPLPSVNHQHALCIHDSISLLLVSSVCFLDSIIDRYVIFAILLFIDLIFFFLHTSL